MWRMREGLLSILIIACGVALAPLIQWMASFIYAVFIGLWVLFELWIR